MIKRNKKGFTLVELLAVIAILGVILSIAVPAVSNRIQESKKKVFFANVSTTVKGVKPLVEVKSDEFSACWIKPFETNESKKTNIEVADGIKKEDGFFKILVYHDGGKIKYAVYAVSSDNDSWVVNTDDFTKITMDGNWELNEYGSLETVVILNALMPLDKCPIS